MKKFRVKNAVVEAEQFDPTKRPWPEGIRAETDGDLDKFEYFYYIPPPKQFSAERYFSANGRIKLNPGDWIIKGMMGEYFIRSPEQFEADYEEVPGQD